MAAKKKSKKAKKGSAAKKSRAGATNSSAERAARAEIKSGVKNLEKSIGGIKKGLRKTE
jgi:hypothetical protein